MLSDYKRGASILHSGFISDFIIMRLSLVSQHLLVFISVLSLTRAQTTTEQTTFPIITSATTPATITPATTTSASTTSAPTTTTATTTSAPPTTTATTTSAPTTTTATTTSAPTTTTTTSAPTTTPATTTSAPTTTTATTTSAPTTTTTSAPTTTPATTTTTTSASASALSTTPATTASGPATTTFALTTTLAGITTTTVTTTTTTTTKSLTDPCYKYTVLDDPWRSPDYRYTQNMCDANVNWVGWYRLFINGQSAQMSETCVNIRSCGTNAPMWLNGTHPTVEDGVVNRDVCGSWSNCCSFPYSIKVKACPGGYYVYEFVRLNVCNAAYCAGKNYFPFIHICVCLMYDIYDFVRPSVSYWLTVKVGQQWWPNHCPSTPPGFQLSSSLLLHNQQEALSAASLILRTVIFLSLPITPMAVSILHTERVGNPLQPTLTGKSHACQPFPL
ncbi:uncharacterized protein [Garra rufa]|uniref:uncharacterized protein n=1 Tax=Garra rufa TaxID=137080 RepID=UPI003CCE5FDF